MSKVATKKATTKKAAAPKVAAKKTPVKKAAASKTLAPAFATEPSPSEKAAFVKAMWHGVQPKAEAGAKKTKTPKAAAPKVEVLRKIPAKKAPVNTALSAQALALAKLIEKAFVADEIDQLQPHALQALMEALCRTYAAQVEADIHEGVISHNSLVSATDVMVVCGALLKAVDLQVFELGMWQTWSGR